MSERAFTATPSMSLKRGQSIGKNIENENYLPKKKRESAIRSENNLKMLIQNGQVDTHKQKVYPKKVLSLEKEARTETLATLISAGKFDKLDKLYIKTVAAASHGSKEDLETSDSDSETLPLPQFKNRQVSETPNESKPAKARNAPNPTYFATVPSNDSNLPNLTSVIQVSNLNNTFNVSNSTNATKVPNSKHSLKYLISINTIKEPNLANISNVSNLTSNTEVPNQTNTFNVSNIKSTTNVSNSEKNKYDPNTTNEDTPLLLGNNKIQNTCEPLDSNIAELSSTNDLDLSKEEETDFDLNRSSLDAEVLALHNLILTLAPDNDNNGTENHRTVDIKHIEDIYKTVINVKTKFNAVYKQKSIKLRKSFESIQLFVPELKRGLTLPTLQELKEKSLATGEETKLLSSQHEQPSYTDNPSPQETKPAKLFSPNT